MFNNAKATEDLDLILGIETKKLDDGTTVIKMGNNTYEFPLTVEPIYKRAA